MITGDLVADAGIYTSQCGCRRAVYFGPRHRLIACPECGAVTSWLREERTGAPSASLSSVASSTPPPVPGQRRRRTGRVSCRFVVECTTPYGARALARTVNLSAGGILLEVDEEDVVVGRPLPAESLGERFMTAFAGSIEFWFAAPGVRASGEVVRCTRVSSASSRLRVGCRFRPPLGPEPRRLLEVQLAGDAPPPWRRDDHPHNGHVEG